MGGEEHRSIGDAADRDGPLVVLGRKPDEFLLDELSFDKSIQAFERTLPAHPYFL